MMTGTNGIAGQPLNTNLVEQKTTTGVGERLATQDASTTGQVAARDAASLSSAGNVLASAATTDDVRADRVESLKSAIASGNYHVDATDVADKLLNNLLK